MAASQEGNRGPVNKLGPRPSRSLSDQRPRERRSGSGACSWHAQQDVQECLPAGSTGWTLSPVSGLAEAAVDPTGSGDWEKVIKRMRLPLPLEAIRVLMKIISKQSNIGIDTERQVSYDIAYMWNLKRMVQMNLLNKTKVESWMY